MSFSRAVRAHPLRSGNSPRKLCAAIVSSVLAQPACCESRTPQSVRAIARWLQAQQRIYNPPRFMRTLFLTT